MNLNQAIITTRFITKDNKAILLVIHDNDGDWQFLGDQEITEKDAVVLSLEQILEHDSSIEELLILPIGFKATRNNAESSWNIERYVE